MEANQEMRITNEGWRWYLEGKYPNYEILQHNRQYNEIHIRDKNHAIESYTIVLSNESINRY